MSELSLTLKSLVMIDRPDPKNRLPLRGLMQCAGLKFSNDKGITGYDVTAASVITDEVAQAVKKAEHVFLPFTISRETDLGKLLAEMLILRQCLALPDFDYAYFGPPPGATS